MAVVRAGVIGGMHGVGRRSRRQDPEREACQWSVATSFPVRSEDGGDVAASQLLFLLLMGSQRGRES